MDRRTHRAERRSLYSPLTHTRSYYALRKVFPFLLILIVVTTSVGCDQLTKDLARDRLQHGASITLVDDLIHLVYAENAGIAFGIGSGLSGGLRFWLFTVGIVGVIAAIGVVAYHRREQGPVFLSGVTLLMAGGVSNLLDRVLNDGHVIDFVVLNIGPMRTIVFNIADVFVCVGAIVLVWSAIRSRRDDDQLQSSPKCLA